MYPLVTFTTLIERFSASAQGAATAALDFTVGSVFRALAEATASLALWFQWLIMLVAVKIRAATSNGSDLDSWMADFVLTRLPAVASTGQVTVARFTATSSALVPVGANMKTADGTVTFRAVADATQTYWNAGLNGYLIPGGISSGTVSVQAVVAGSVGNVLAGTITLLATGIAGIDTVTNAGAFTNGIDAETDAALRIRFAAYIASLARATTAAVQFAISSVQQGLSSTIQENIDESSVYKPGHFVVTVDDGSGTPPSALLTAVSLAIAAYRPVGSTWSVQAPTVTTVNVVLTISVQAPGIKANLQPLVQIAIAAYINSIPMGGLLALTRVAQVAYAVSPYITNVSALTLNSSGADIAPNASHVVKAGTVTCN